MSEFTDLMTIAEMTPGPITVNSATFVGIRMAATRRARGDDGLHSAVADHRVAFVMAV